METIQNYKESVNIVFIIPVTPAVISIIIRRFIVPYFSSIIGPINNI